MDGDNKWLYYVTARGRLGRIEVDNPTNNEILFEHNDFSGGPFAYIAYSAFEDCFYVTTDKNKILKVWVKEDGTHAYEQINQNNTGTTDGFLADEAKFQYLRGLTIDEDGNIFVCQGDNSHVIRKIAYEANKLLDITEILILTIKAWAAAQERLDIKKKNQDGKQAPVS